MCDTWERRRFLRTHGPPLGSRVWSRVAALILADIGIARLGGNLLPLPLQDEINGRDFIFGLDRRL